MESSGENTIVVGGAGASERHRRESLATGGARVVILDTVQADGKDVAAATGASFHEMDGAHGLDSFRATIDLNLIGSGLAAGQMSSRPFRVPAIARACS
jgi:hypothetical protein